MTTLIWRNSVHPARFNTAGMSRSVRVSQDALQMETRIKTWHGSQSRLQPVVAVGIAIHCVAILAIANAADNDTAKLPKPITGTVHTFDGKPAHGAHVAAIGYAWRGPYLRDGQWPNREFIGSSVCDAEGRFRLESFKPSDVPWQAVQLIVSAPGNALHWRPIDLYHDHAKPVEFSLLPASRMRGGLKTSDGTAAVGISVRIGAIGESRLGLDNLLVPDGGLPDDFYPTTLKTDENGEFAAGQLPPHAHVRFRIDRETFAPQPLEWKFDDSIPLEATLTPGQIVTGIVLAADTGQPLAHAILSAGGTYVESDGHGQFRMNVPAAGIDIQAMGPRNMSYLGKRLTVKEFKAGKSQDLKIELPRGVAMREQ